MASIIHPLLAILASHAGQELARQVAYLCAENPIVRSKLPEQIMLSNQEKRKLSPDMTVREIETRDFRLGCSSLILKKRH
jgi:hypothetical protein